jgi:hypothetical protein
VTRELIDRLEEAIRTHCVEAMGEHSKHALDTLDTRSLVADYAAWKALFPSQQPRAVYESDSLTSSPLRSTYASGLSAIRRDIEAGADLRRYLTSLVRFPHHRDRLLAHAGIHHLHLSDVTKEWGRVARQPHVLFVAFRPDAAYLIDIYAHESDGANWAERAILETIVRNWPESGTLGPSRFASGLTRDYDDDARAKLRCSGVNLAVELDGRVWLSPGATMTNAPLMADRIGMKVVAELHALRAGQVELARRLADHGSGHAASLGEWIPAVHDEHYGFYCQQANVFVRCGCLVVT